MDEDDLPKKSAMRVEREETIAEELRGLADDARALAQAEFAYQKSRASYAGRQALIIAILGGAALVFLFFAVEALVFGAILALTPKLTALGATAAVTGGLGAAALISVLVAFGTWKRMKSKISERDD